MLTYLTVAIAVYVVFHFQGTNLESAYTTTTITDGKAKFVLGNDYGVPVSGHKTLTFEVKACGNVYLLLAEKIHVAPRQGNYYFVALGVTKSHRISGIIEGCYACNTFHNYKLRTVLNCTEFRKFKVTWDGNGLVNIYQGSEAKGKPLLHFQGKKKYPVNFFHVTSYNLTAEFRFHLPCKIGTYGENCTSGCGRCKCGNQCDPESGLCEHGCEPGWTGPLCVQECSNNTYGSDCTPCGHCRGGVACDVETGHCPKSRCEAGWVGDRCERECPVGTYGPYCQPCGFCKDRSACDADTGHCPGNCLPGWSAEKCDIKCPGSTHGQNCTSCGHCLGEDTCHIESGHCPNGCDPGWTGPMCEDKCNSTTYGHECAYQCGKCKISPECDHVTGSCLFGCKAGWYGLQCQRECPMKTFGLDCTSLCGHCINNSQCERATGACADGCEPGWKGANCDRIDIPNEIRMTTVTIPVKPRNNRKQFVLRTDTIVSIVLGILSALLIGILIMLVWRRAVNSHTSKYKANYDGRSDTKQVSLDENNGGNSAFENPGYVTLNGLHSQI